MHISDLSVIFGVLLASQYTASWSYHGGKDANNILQPPPPPPPPGFRGDKTSDNIDMHGEVLENGAVNHPPPAASRDHGDKHKSDTERIIQAKEAQLIEMHEMEEELKKHDNYPPVPPANELDIGELPPVDLKTGRVLTRNRRALSRQKRTITSNTDYRWDDGIVPYEFEKENSEHQVAEYEQSISRYEFHTCIRFVEHNENTSLDHGLNHNNYINFLASANGCWSYVGNIRWWNGQSISCCDKWACVHEIGHAMGLNHEQESPIRDEWIRVNWENIKPGSRQWFAKPRPSSVIQNRYDFTSDMHYGLHAFSWHGKKSMEPLDPNQEYLLSASEDFFYMFKIVSEEHNCQAVACPELEGVTCENHGYVSPYDGECQCICPTGLDPESHCAGIYTGDDSLKSKEWLPGNYALLKSTDECPSTMMKVGTSTHYGASDAETNKRYTAAGGPVGENITFEYCVQDSAEPLNIESSLWPRGLYCILRAGGSCPTGFKNGSIEFGDVFAPTAEGTLPDLDLEDTSLTNYCCRDDGADEDPRSFPTSSPFILFKKAHTCQTVKDMSKWSQFFTFANVNASSIRTSGSVPYTKINEAKLSVYFCYYEPMNYDCGGVYEVDRSSRYVSFNSPNYPSEYNNNQMCTWLVKAPEGTNLKLSIEDLSIERPADGNGCWDSLEIRDNWIGQAGHRYCGEGFKGSVLTESNTLMLTLRTNYGIQQRGFKANVELITPEEMCYDVADEGRTYRGLVNYTVDYEPCLPWSEVTNCRHHAFHQEDLFDGLSGNFCRNPGHGKRPWCYTVKDTCTRNYCDVCQKGTCYDKDASCADDKAVDDKFCESTASSQFCRETCGYCYRSNAQDVPVSAKTCKKPCQIVDSTTGVMNATYKVGSSIEFVCKTDNRTLQERTCLTDGSWTAGRYVCGGCSSGWVNNNGSCYKYNDQAQYYEDAVETCAKHDALVSPMKDESEMIFIDSLRDKNRVIWIGMSDDEIEGQWVWSDGTNVTFFNWADEQPNNWGNGEDCATMKQIWNENKWNDVYCENYHKYPFVCKKSITTEREICADQIKTCDDLISATPDACSSFHAFAHQTCPRSCGQCGEVNVCDAVSPSVNVTLLDEADFVVTGEHIKYSCLDGYILQSGDLNRACLKNGQLSGKDPHCLALDDSTGPNNDIVITSRPYGSWSWWAVLGDNDNMKIHRNGTLIAWHFWASDGGEVALQILRPLSRNTEDNTMEVELIAGKKLNVHHDREYYVELTEEEQINVLPDDLIGLDFEKNGYTIKYSSCDSENNPEAKDWKYGWIWDSEEKGAKATFRPFSSCRIYSVQAIIAPL